jgi:hypothetical protein
LAVAGYYFKSPLKINTELSTWDRARGDDSSHKEGKGDLGMAEIGEETTPIK